MSKYDINLRNNKITGFNEVRFTNEDALKEATKRLVDAGIIKPNHKVFYINEWRGLTSDESKVVFNLVNEFIFSIRMCPDKY